MMVQNACDACKDQGDRAGDEGMERSIVTCDDIVCCELRGAQVRRTKPSTALFKNATLF